VILSGGDPLSLTTHRLARLIHKLESVPHLARLRIHSRLPVVLPARIEDVTPAMVDGMFAPLSTGALELPTRQEMQAARV